MKRKIIILASVVLALITLFSLVSCGTKYTVTIDLAGGTGIEKTEIKVKEGGTISDPGTPTKEGYKFLGWYIGDSPKAWDFEKTVVNSDMTMRAAWRPASSSNDVCNDGGEHEFEVIEDIAPTCTESGKTVKKCVKCRTKDTQRYPALKHDFVDVVTAPTCGERGFTTTTCTRENCDYINIGTYVNATGDHQWSDEVKGEFKTIVAPTKYTAGLKARWCLVCNKEETSLIKPKYSNKEINNLVIGNFKYTGGTYVESPFVNIAGYAGVTVSSYYTVCLANNVADGKVDTYWSADTVADGANFTGEWLLLKFEEKRDVGAVNVILPNYTAWELGDGCHVEYEVEFLVDGEWISVGTVSDKNATTEGMNAKATIVLPQPYNTDSVRLTVNHSTRFTAPIIYEIEVLAHTEKTYREPVSMNASSSIAVSGKYNDWSPGGGALIDGDANSYWSTNWNRKGDGKVYADLEFAKETFIAAVQFTTKNDVGRKFSLQKWVVDEDNPEGHFVEIKQYAVPEKQSKDFIYSTANGQTTITFTENLEEPILKLRLELIHEPIYWESFIYSFEAHTVEEKADGVLDYMGCKHRALDDGEAVQPTCVSAGYTVMTCGCGYITKSKFTDALGHTWGEYVATAKSGDGTRVSTCTVCSATKSKQFNEQGNSIVEVTQYLKNAKATWSHTLDDGNYLDTYEWANEFMGKYKHRATIVMAITYSDSLVSLWQEHFSKGVFDLGSHSYDHGPYYTVSAISENSFLKDVNRAHYWFMHNFKGQRLIGFATPGGTTSVNSAKYLAGFYYANRIGDSPRIYNLPSELIGREMWGRLNSYVSKADQTEGAYVLFDSEGNIGGYKVVPATKVIIDEETGEEKEVFVTKTEKVNGKDVETIVFTIEWVDNVATLKKTPVTEQVVDEETGETKEVETGEYIYEIVSTGAGYSTNSLMNKENTVSNYREEDAKYILIYDITKPDDGEVTVEDLKFVKIADLASNFVFDSETLRLVDQPELSGSYLYTPETYVFSWEANGSYDFDPATGKFEFKDNGTGKYTLRHTTLGSYEDGINTALDVGGWIIDCVHSYGSGSIYSTYASSVSKFEYMKKTHIWGASYTDAIQYLREYQNSHVDVTSMTDSEIKISLTDTLDDYMFNHALTVKVAIPQSWEGKTITVTQAGVEIPFIADIDEYYDDFARKACTVMDGYLYLDAVPDRGEIVVTVSD